LIDAAHRPCYFFAAMMMIRNIASVFFLSR
jgi:hypothetical protein